MSAHDNDSSRKHVVQEEFWKSIINKYEERNLNLENEVHRLSERVNHMDTSVPAVMTYNMAKLAKERPDTDVGKFMQSSSGPSSSYPKKCPPECQPLQLPDMQNMSVFSIEAADICYMDKIKELTKREGILIAEVNNLKSKQKAMQNAKKKIDDFMDSSPKGGGGITVKEADLGGLNDRLVEENKRLFDEVADLKIELKHVRENVEGPKQRELERERRKNVMLEAELRQKDQECEEKNSENFNELKLLRKQQEANEKNISDMRDINNKLKQEIDFLTSRMNQMQTDMINQKLSEATTLALMKAELENEKKKHKGPSTRSSFTSKHSGPRGPPDDKPGGGTGGERGNTQNESKTPSTYIKSTNLDSGAGSAYSSQIPGRGAIEPGIGPGDRAEATTKSAISSLAPIGRLGDTVSKQPIEINESQPTGNKTTFALPPENEEEFHSATEGSCTCGTGSGSNASSIHEAPERGPKHDCLCGIVGAGDDLYTIARDLSKEIEEAKQDKAVPDTLLKTVSEIKDLCDFIDQKCTCQSDRTPESMHRSLREVQCVCEWTGQCELESTKSSGTASGYCEGCTQASSATMLNQEVHVQQRVDQKISSKFNDGQSCKTGPECAISELSSNKQNVEGASSYAKSIKSDHCKDDERTAETYCVDNLVTTTTASCGYIEIVTKGVEGKIVTSLGITESGNIEIITEITENQDEAINVEIENASLDSEDTTEGGSQHSNYDCKGCGPISEKSSQNTSNWQMNDDCDCQPRKHYNATGDNEETNIDINEIPINEGKNVIPLDFGILTESNDMYTNMIIRSLSPYVFERLEVIPEVDERIASNLSDIEIYRSSRVNISITNSSSAVDANITEDVFPLTNKSVCCEDIKQPDTYRPFGDSVSEYKMQQKTITSKTFSESHLCMKSEKKQPPKRIPPFKQKHDDHDESFKEMRPEAMIPATTDESFTGMNPSELACLVLRSSHPEAELKKISDAFPMQENSTQILQMIHVELESAMNTVDSKTVNSKNDNTKSDPKKEEKTLSSEEVSKILSQFTSVREYPIPTTAQEHLIYTMPEISTPHCKYHTNRHLENNNDPGAQLNKPTSSCPCGQDRSPNTRFQNDDKNNYANILAQQLVELNKYQCTCTTNSKCPVCALHAQPPGQSRNKSQDMYNQKDIKDFANNDMTTFEDTTFESQYFFKIKTDEDSGPARSTFYADKKSVLLPVVVTPSVAARMKDFKGGSKLITLPESVVIDMQTFEAEYARFFEKTSDPLPYGNEPIKEKVHKNGKMYNGNDRSRCSPGCLAHPENLPDIVKAVAQAVHDDTNLSPNKVCTGTYMNIEDKKMFHKNRKRRCERCKMKKVVHEAGTDCSKKRKDIQVEANDRNVCIPSCPKRLNAANNATQDSGPFIEECASTCLFRKSKSQKSKPEKARDLTNRCHCTQATEDEYEFSFMRCLKECKNLFAQLVGSKMAGHEVKMTPNVVNALDKSHDVVCNIYSGHMVNIPNGEQPDTANASLFCLNTCTASCSKFVDNSNSAPQACIGTCTGSCSKMSVKAEDQVQKVETKYNADVTGHVNFNDTSLRQTDIPCDMKCTAVCSTKNLTNTCDNECRAVCRISCMNQHAVENISQKNVCVGPCSKVYKSTHDGGRRPSQVCPNPCGGSCVILHDIDLKAGQTANSRDKPPVENRWNVNEKVDCRLSCASICAQDNPITCLSECGRKNIKSAEGDKESHRVVTVDASSLAKTCVTDAASVARAADDMATSGPPSKFTTSQHSERSGTSKKDTSCENECKAICVQVRAVAQEGKSCDPQCLVSCTQPLIMELKEETGDILGNTFKAALEVSSSVRKALGTALKSDDVVTQEIINEYMSSSPSSKFATSHHSERSDTSKKDTQCKNECTATCAQIGGVGQGSKFCNTQCQASCRQPLIMGSKEKTCGDILGDTFKHAIEVSSGAREALGTALKSDEVVMQEIMNEHMSSGPSSKFESSHHSERSGVSKKDTQCTNECTDTCAQIGGVGQGSKSCVPQCQASCRQPLIIGSKEKTCGDILGDTFKHAIEVSSCVREALCTALKSDNVITQEIMRDMTESERMIATISASKGGSQRGDTQTISTSCTSISTKTVDKASSAISCTKQIIDYTIQNIDNSIADLERADIAEKDTASVKFVNMVSVSNFNAHVPVIHAINENIEEQPLRGSLPTSSIKNTDMKEEDENDGVTIAYIVFNYSGEESKASVAHAIYENIEEQPLQGSQPTSSIRNTDMKEEDENDGVIIAYVVFNYSGDESKGTTVQGSVGTAERPADEVHPYHEQMQGGSSVFVKTTDLEPNMEVEIKPIPQHPRCIHGKLCTDRCQQICSGIHPAANNTQNSSSVASNMTSTMIGNKDIASAQGDQDQYASMTSAANAERTVSNRQGTDAKSIPGQSASKTSTTPSGIDQDKKLCMASCGPECLNRKKDRTITSTAFATTATVNQDGVTLITTNTDDADMKSGTTTATIATGNKENLGTIYSSSNIRDKKSSATLVSTATGNKENTGTVHSASSIGDKKSGATLVSAATGNKENISIRHSTGHLEDYKSNATTATGNKDNTGTVYSASNIGGEIDILFSIGTSNKETVGTTHSASNVENNKSASTLATVGTGSKKTVTLRSASDIDMVKSTGTIETASTVNKQDEVVTAIFEQNLYVQTSKPRYDDKTSVTSFEKSMASQTSAAVVPIELKTVATSRVRLEPCEAACTAICADFDKLKITTRSANALTIPNDTKGGNRYNKEADEASALDSIHFKDKIDNQIGLEPCAVECTAICVDFDKHTIATTTYANTQSTNAPTKQDGNIRGNLDNKGADIGAVDAHYKEPCEAACTAICANLDKHAIATASHDTTPSANVTTKLDGNIGGNRDSKEAGIGPDDRHFKEPCSATCTDICANFDKHTIAAASHATTQSANDTTKLDDNIGGNCDNKGADIGLVGAHFKEPCSATCTHICANFDKHTIATASHATARSVNVTTKLDDNKGADIGPVGANVKEPCEAPCTAICAICDKHTITTASHGTTQSVNVTTKLDDNIEGNRDNKGADIGPIGAHFKDKTENQIRLEPCEAACTAICSDFDKLTIGTSTHGTQSANATIKSVDNKEADKRCSPDGTHFKDKTENQIRLKPCKAACAAICADFDKLTIATATHATRSANATIKPSDNKGVKKGCSPDCAHCKDKIQNPSVYMDKEVSTFKKVPQKESFRSRPDGKHSVATCTSSCSLTNCDITCDKGIVNQNVQCPDMNKVPNERNIQTRDEGVDVMFFSEKTTAGQLTEQYLIGGNIIATEITSFHYETGMGQIKVAEEGVQAEKFIATMDTEEIEMNITPYEKPSKIPVRTAMYPSASTNLEKKSLQNADTSDKKPGGTPKSCRCSRIPISINIKCGTSGYKFSKTISCGSFSCPSVTCPPYEKSKSRKIDNTGRWCDCPDINTLMEMMRRDLTKSSPDMGESSSHRSAHEPKKIRKDCADKCIQGKDYSRLSNDHFKSTCTCGLYPKQKSEPLRSNSEKPGGSSKIPRKRCECSKHTQVENKYQTINCFCQMSCVCSNNCFFEKLGLKTEASPLLIDETCMFFSDDTDSKGDGDSVYCVKFNEDKLKASILDHATDCTCVDCLTQRGDTLQRASQIPKHIGQMRCTCKQHGICDKCKAINDQKLRAIQKVGFKSEDRVGQLIDDLTQKQEQEKREETLSNIVGDDNLPFFTLPNGASYIVLIPGDMRMVQHVSAYLRATISSAIILTELTTDYGQQIFELVETNETFEIMTRQIVEKMSSYDLPAIDIGDGHRVLLVPITLSIKNILDSSLLELDVLTERRSKESLGETLASIVGEENLPLITIPNDGSYVTLVHGDEEVVQHVAEYFQDLMSTDVNLLYETTDFGVKMFDIMPSTETTRLAAREIIEKASVRSAVLPAIDIGAGHKLVMVRVTSTIDNIVDEILSELDPCKVKEHEGVAPDVLGDQNFPLTVIPKEGGSYIALVHGNEKDVQNIAEYLKEIISTSARLSQQITDSGVRIFDIVESTPIMRIAAAEMMEQESVQSAAQVAVDIADGHKLILLRVTGTVENVLHEMLPDVVSATVDLVTEKENLSTILGEENFPLKTIPVDDSYIAFIHGDEEVVQHVAEYLKGTMSVDTRLSQQMTGLGTKIFDVVDSNAPTRMAAEQIIEQASILSSIHTIVNLGDGHKLLLVRITSMIENLLEEILPDFDIQISKHSGKYGIPDDTISSILGDENLPLRAIPKDGSYVVLVHGDEEVVTHLADYLKETMSEDVRLSQQATQTGAKIFAVEKSTHSARIAAEQIMEQASVSAHTVLTLGDGHKLMLVCVTATIENLVEEMLPDFDSRSHKSDRTGIPADAISSILGPNNLPLRTLPKDGSYIALVRGDEEVVQQLADFLKETMSEAVRLSQQKTDTGAKIFAIEKSTYSTKIAVEQIMKKASICSTTAEIGIGAGHTLALVRVTPSIDDILEDVQKQVDKYVLKKTQGVLEDTISKILGPENFPLKTLPKDGSFVALVPANEDVVQQLAEYLKETMREDVDLTRQRTDMGTKMFDLVPSTCDNKIVAEHIMEEASTCFTTSPICVGGGHKLVLVPVTSTIETLLEQEQHVDNLNTTLADIVGKKNLPLVTIPKNERLFVTFVPGDESVVHNVADYLKDTLCLDKNLSQQTTDTGCKIFDVVKFDDGLKMTAEQIIEQQSVGAGPPEAVDLGEGYTLQLVNVAANMEYLLEDVRKEIDNQKVVESSHVDYTLSHLVGQENLPLKTIPMDKSFIVIIPTDEEVVKQVADYLKDTMSIDVKLSKQTTGSGVKIFNVVESTQVIKAAADQIMEQVSAFTTKPPVVEIDHGLQLILVAETETVQNIIENLSELQDTHGVCPEKVCTKCDACFNTEGTIDALKHINLDAGPFKIISILYGEIVLVPGQSKDEIQETIKKLKELLKAAKLNDIPIQSIRTAHGQRVFRNAEKTRSTIKIATRFNDLLKTQNVEDLPYDKCVTTDDIVAVFLPKDQDDENVNDTSEYFSAKSSLDEKPSHGTDNDILDIKSDTTKKSKPSRKPSQESSGDESVEMEFVICDFVKPGESITPSKMGKPDKDDAPSDPHAGGTPDEVIPRPVEDTIEPRKSDKDKLEPEPSDDIFATRRPHKDKIKPASDDDLNEPRRSTKEKIKSWIDDHTVDPRKSHQDKIDNEPDDDTIDVERSHTDKRVSGLDEIEPEFNDDINEQSRSNKEKIKSWFDDHIVDPIKSHKDKRQSRPDDDTIDARISHKNEIEPGPDDDVNEAKRSNKEKIKSWFDDHIVDPIKAHKDKRESRPDDDTIDARISHKDEIELGPDDDVNEARRSNKEKIKSWFDDHIVDPIKSHKDKRESRPYDDTVKVRISDKDEIETAADDDINESRSNKEKIKSWFDDHIVDPIKSHKDKRGSSPDDNTIEARKPQQDEIEPGIDENNIEPRRSDDYNMETRRSSKEKTEPEPEDHKVEPKMSDKAKSGGGSSSLLREQPVYKDVKDDDAAIHQDVKILQDLLKKIKCSCAKAQLEMGQPFTKKSSQLENTLSALQIALEAFDRKCITKDMMIDVLKKELEVKKATDLCNKIKHNDPQRTQEFNKIINDDQIDNPCCIDDLELFTSPIICPCDSPQPAPSCDCNKDGPIMEVIDVRRIAKNNIMLKWTAPLRNDIGGFEIYINGVMMSRIYSPRRRTAIIDTINLSSNLEIRLCLLGPCARDISPAIAYYNL